MYRLSDEIISQIAKLVQLAMLTGTDVDNLRTMRVEQDGETDELVLTDEYREIAENQLEKLLQELESLNQGEQN